MVVSRSKLISTDVEVKTSGPHDLNRADQFLAVLQESILKKRNSQIQIPNVGPEITGSAVLLPAAR